MFLGILGGTPEYWAQYGHAYREAWAQAGHPAGQADIAVAAHGFVANTGADARTTYLEYERRMMAAGAAELGRPAPQLTGRAADLEAGGMVFAGSPDEIADRILHLHRLLGHTRQILQMDVGGMPTATSSTPSNYSVPRCYRRSTPNSRSRDRSIPGNWAGAAPSCASPGPGRLPVTRPGGRRLPE